MRFTRYTKYKGGWMDALNLESLLESLSDFLLNGGFAGGPNFHPYWGWSGTEDTTSLDALKHALLQALLESGDLTPEMIEELRGEGAGDAEMQQKIAEMLDDLIQRMVEEGYISLENGVPTVPGQPQDVTGQGQIDDAKEAAQHVEFNLTQKGMDFLGYRSLKGLLGALGKSTAGTHDTPELSTGVEAGAASKPYEFGDTMNLDIPATLKNAIEREGLQVPLNIDYSDLMVHQSEYRSSCATVLMLDISHSMILYGEDRFAPAKRVALALSHLIRTQFPGDTLRVITFGDRAQEIRGIRAGSPHPHVPEAGHAADHHDHRRKAQRRDPSRGEGLHQLRWPGRLHPPEDLPGDGGVQEGGHPHQHLHARPGPVPGAVRPEGVGDRSG